MRSKYYDVVFLGGSIGGLLSAITLLKKGIKVLLINPDDYFYPYRKQPNASTPVMYFGGFTLRNLLKTLGFHPLEINKLKALDPSLQVIMPGIRFDLYSDEKKLLTELKREFPDIWGEANTFFNKLSEYQDFYPKMFMSKIKFPPENFIDRYRLRSHIKRLGQPVVDERPLPEILGPSISKNPKFRLLVKGIVNALSDISMDNFSLPYISQIINTVRFEGYDFEGGLKAFHDLLMEKIKERGGMILNDCQVEEVNLDGRYVDSLKLSGTSIDKLVLSYLVLNGNPKSIFKMLPGSRKNFILKKRFSKLEPKYFRYTFYMKIKSQAFPEGMRDRAVIITDGNLELSAENFLYVERTGKERDENAEEILVLSVSAFLKPSMTAENFLSDFRARCVEKMTAVMPFLPEYIVKTETPPVKKIDELDKDIRSNFVFEGANSWFNVTALPYSSYLKNLFLVGQAVYPGLGFDGEVQAGLKVSREISSSLKVKRP